MCLHHVQSTHTLTGGRACWQNLRRDTFSARIRQLKNIYSNNTHDIDISIKLTNAEGEFDVLGKAAYMLVFDVHKMEMITNHSFTATLIMA